MLQYDNHLLGLKRLKVAISNPPKRGESTNRATGKGAQFGDGSFQKGQSELIRGDVTFVRPSFVPSRLKTQEQTE